MGNSEGCMKDTAVWKSLVGNKYEFKEFTEYLKVYSSVDTWNNCTAVRSTDETSLFVLHEDRLYPSDCLLRV